MLDQKSNIKEVSSQHPTNIEKKDTHDPIVLIKKTIHFPSHHDTSKEKFFKQLREGAHGNPFITSPNPVNDESDEGFEVIPLRASTKLEDGQIKSPDSPYISRLKHNLRVDEDVVTLKAPYESDHEGFLGVEHSNTDSVIPSPDLFDVNADVVRKFSLQEKIFLEDKMVSVVEMHRTINEYKRTYQKQIQDLYEQIERYEILLKIERERNAKLELMLEGTSDRNPETKGTDSLKNLQKKHSNIFIQDACMPVLWENPNVMMRILCMHGSCVLITV